MRRVRVRPLPSAVFLGARHILAMSAGYQPTPDEARPVLQGSPAAQVMGQLLRENDVASRIDELRTFLGEPAAAAISSE
ncbi:MAG TPA: hypothetical protein VF713_00085 [Thermoanaerobaculia bacterium]